jgi:hypothetical protein
MKGILKKTLAILLVFSFVFVFAACNDDEKETTTAAITTVEGDTTIEETTLEGETTVEGETTAEDETTTEAATALELPISGTSAEIISFYNEYGNAIKTYKDKVTVTKTDGTVSEVNHIAGGKIIENLALDLLPNDYKAKPTYTFVNGTSTADNKTLTKWLPRSDSAKLSELSTTGTNGVKSATCTASGTGCKIVIMMNDDKTSGATALSNTPKYVSKCMDTLDLTSDDIAPFTLESAEVIYTGCKVEAVFDAQGRMTKLDIVTPAQIKGTLKKIIQLKDTNIVGDYKATYTFAY